MRDWKKGVVQPFNAYKADESGETDATSYIALYDPDTHAEKGVVQVPCPNIEQQTMDEEGNLYLGTAYNTSLAKLYGKGPAACVVKMSPDGVIDEAFGYNDLTGLTAGLYGVNFRYIGNQKALVNVLHHERLEGVDWAAEPDPAVETKVSGGWVDMNYVPADGSLWSLHLVDLVAKTSQIITGFKPGHNPANYSSHTEIDGRIFFTLLDKQGEETYNATYELDVAAGTVAQVGYAVGEVDMIRLR
jgi:hypothetical protein